MLQTMINEVYYASESNIWKKEHQRVSMARLTEIFKKKELIIAKISDEIVGCIHLEPMNAKRFKFKMLAVHPVHQRKGIANQLVAKAEEVAISRAGEVMQLELLVPTDFVHPDKVVLTNWYTKLGYQKTATHEVDYVHQGISQFLITNCQAIVYEKPLISQ